MTPAAPLHAAAFDPGTVSSLPSVAYSVGMLFLVCIIAYFALRFLYARGPKGSLGLGKRFVRVIDRFPLAAQRYLLIVEVAGKYYLLGVTEQSITFLTALDEAALSKEIPWPQSPEGGFAPFSSTLSALSRRWKKSKEE